MDSSQERGRRLSSQGRHASPQPSPHNYHDPNTGLDPSIGAHTFTTGKFNTANPQDLSAQNNGAQPYLNNFSLEQNAMMNNQYMGQMYGSNQFNPAFALQSNYGDSLGQDFSLSQYPNLNQQDSVNPADLSRMSSPPEQRSPRLLSPENHPSPGPQSPTSTNGQYHTPQHSRNISLDPNSAYGGNDWQAMSFRQQQHQRTPSDVSDVSSVHASSPFMQQAELHDVSRSPLFVAQDGNTFGMDNFSLGEQLHSQPGSTYVSPRLMPQQEGMGSRLLSQQDGLGQGGDTLLNSSFMASDIFPHDQSYQNLGGMHARNQSVASQMGQADQVEPPSIHIEPAPVSRQQSFGPQGEMMQDALSPPSNNGRGRNRSKSDVTYTRPVNSARSVSPGPSSRHASLSPAGSTSRASSPGISDGNRISKERRASTTSINNNNREYILDLADPNRPSNVTGPNGTRVQKHPATFQCSLCPKRFTRAYNLRSHLRTHTDERPFVCTVCGKAFARQHDRKRHEGLHSGEKKFVCKGELTHSPGQTWGCGRRFARADALGRHFRSEAGRVCIKPLLDEEAAERTQKMMMEQQMNVNAQHQAQMQAHGMLQPVPQPMMIPSMDANPGFALPAALLAQYPSLANIDWNALQAGADDPGELSDVGYGGGYDDGSFGDGHLSDSGLPMLSQHHNQWS